MNILPGLTLATFNQGKLAEYSRMLAELPIELRALDSFADISEIDETGETFKDNARKKASGYGRQTVSYVLADDSGLAIDALDGRPGVHSARYGGTETDFALKMQLVLDELREKPACNRNARFVCAIAIAGPDGKIVFEASGVCEGRIAKLARGSGGFGYDPIFIPDGFDQTFGELSAQIKQKMSHRARAMSQIIPFLRDNIASLT
jgi:XTP/dITP diphosphohydrolase